MTDQQQLRQHSLLSLEDIPPMLLLQDPRFTYILRYQVLRPPQDEGSFLLRCFFDNISGQAQELLRYRLRVYRFGKQAPRLVEGPLTMKGEMSIWPGDQGTLEILVGGAKAQVQNRLVFTVQADGGIALGKGTTISLLGETEEPRATAGEAGDSPFAPGTLGAYLLALTEDLLQEPCARCQSRHPRYLIVGGGQQQAYPFEALAYHQRLDQAERWLHHPCVQRGALLRHPYMEVIYGYVVDLSGLWGQRCPQQEETESHQPPVVEPEPGQ